MKNIQIFDPALCCSSGVCGQGVDQALVSLAADLDWAKQQGAVVERFNLAQQPMAFVQNTTVKSFLERSGAEALPLVFEMLEDEGICLGGSSGINIAGAVRMARDMGPGKTIVTILCDYGNRYQSKLYNPAFLKEKGLPVPQWLDRAPSAIPTVFEDA